VVRSDSFFSRRSVFELILVLSLSSITVAGFDGDVYQPPEDLQQDEQQDEGEQLADISPIHLVHC